MSKFGFVYLLANACMPCCYKIGRTDRAPHARAAELSSGTAVPEPFQVLCYIEVADPAAVEAHLHQFLGDFRINYDREFFRFAPIHMAWVGGLFKWHPDQTAYTECELWQYCNPSSGELINPWAGGGDDPEMTQHAPLEHFQLKLVA